MAKIGDLAEVDGVGYVAAPEEEATTESNGCPGCAADLEDGYWLCNQLPKCYGEGVDPIIWKVRVP